MSIEMLPISVKGVIFEKNSVWLRKNERKEWELPGGKIEKGEQPTEALKREIYEELGFLIEVENIIDSTILKITKSIDESGGVLVQAYLCKILGKSGKFELIGESGKAEFRLMPILDIKSLKMDDFYKKAISETYKR